MVTINNCCNRLRVLRFKTQFLQLLCFSLNTTINNTDKIFISPNKKSRYNFRKHHVLFYFKKNYLVLSL